MYVCSMHGCTYVCNGVIVYVVNMYLCMYAMHVMYALYVMSVIMYVLYDLYVCMYVGR